MKYAGILCNVLLSTSNVYAMTMDTYFDHLPGDILNYFINFSPYGALQLSALGYKIGFSKVYFSMSAMPSITRQVVQAGDPVVLSYVMRNIQYNQFACISLIDHIMLYRKYEVLDNPDVSKITQYTESMYAARYEFSDHPLSVRCKLTRKKIVKRVLTAVIVGIVLIAIPVLLLFFDEISL